MDLRLKEVRELVVWGAFCLFFVGSLWQKDRWLPCTERSYYGGVVYLYLCLVTELVVEVVRTKRVVRMIMLEHSASVLRYIRLGVFTDKYRPRNISKHYRKHLY